MAPSAHHRHQRRQGMPTPQPRHHRRQGMPAPPPPRFQSAQPQEFPHHRSRAYHHIQYYTAAAAATTTTPSPPAAASIWYPFNWTASATPLMPSMLLNDGPRWNLEEATVIFDETAAMGPPYNRNHRSNYMEQDDGVLIFEAAALPEQNGDHEKDSGLSKDAILNRIQTRKCNSREEEGKICVVCQDEMNSKEEKGEIGILACGHEYHVSCIVEWLKRKNSCPLCKAVAL